MTPKPGNRAKNPQLLAVITEIEGRIWMNLNMVKSVKISIWGTTLGILDHFVGEFSLSIISLHFGTLSCFFQAF